MAQLKDSLITGDLRVTGTIYGNVPLADLVDADDLKAIEGLTGTSGWLKKTAANTWALGTFAASDIPNIDASKITSGTLPIARGGTGLTASPSMLTNLASTTAANVLQASPRPGVTGTLGAANGGTGKTTLKDAANALINALDTGSSNLTANDYVITQYVGGGTTTTTYHRRPASALRVGGLLTARNLGVNLASTTAVTFDGTANQTNIPVSGTLPVANGGTGATSLANITVGKATADASGNTITTTYATKTEMNSLIAAADAMVFKGTIGSSGATVTALPNTHNVGWTYRVLTAGTYAGVKCEIGDLIICIADGTAANNAHWTVAQTNIDGAVVGPASATNGNIALFDGTTGKLIKNSDYSPSSFATAGHNHDSVYVNISGDTMTGQLKTSFKNSVAMGTYQAASTTIEDLCEELRYSSGVAGSANITTAYTKNGVTIGAKWYNFIWVPHRSGGTNGAANGDNCNYGSLYLSGMTSSGLYMVRYSSSAIAEVQDLYKDNTVVQTATTTDANYEVLFSATADNTTRTEGTRKNSNLLFNPSTGSLTAAIFNNSIKIDSIKAWAKTGPYEEGWTRVCALSGYQGYGVGRVYINGSWSSEEPTIAAFEISFSNTNYAHIKQTLGAKKTTPDKVRLVYSGTGGKWYFDIHIPARTASSATGNRYVTFVGKLTVSEKDETTNYITTEPTTLTVTRDIIVTDDQPTITVNLASTTAGSFTGANMTTGISGKLSIANGGTNATTAADARTNLGLGTLATKSTISDHSVTTPTGATSRTQDVTLKNNIAATVTSAGTWPTLGTAFTIPNVTAAGTASYANGVLTITNTTTGTAFTVPNVTSIGTKPTFGTTTVAIDKQPTFSVTTQTTTLSHTIS